LSGVVLENSQKLGFPTPKKGIDIEGTGLYSTAVNENCSFSSDSSNSFLSTLLRAAQYVENTVESALGEAGLSLAKLGVLNHLVQAGEPLPLGRIAGRIACVKSNVTQLVDRLEADGLVIRISDPNDRRCVRAGITDEGRRRYDVGAQILQRQEQALLNYLSPEQRDEIISSLSRLGTNLAANTYAEVVNR
jgi:DNA-binding MarR family transcriptional regulator